MRVILAEDSLLFREGLARLLAELDVQVVAQTGSTADLMQLVAMHRPDVVVLDIRMPPTHTDEGLVAAVEIRRTQPAVGVLLLSQYVETQLIMTLLEEGGGVGYLLKDRVSDLDAFSSAITTVARGGSVVDPEVVSTLVSSRRRGPLDHLTDREKDVLRLMAEGRTNQAISERLFLSPKTIEAHVTAIFSKLDLDPTPNDHRRVLAVLHYLRHA
ncbi:MAG: response regulator transcription factor [Candidatus Dormibacteraeota bacterium]|nr:response regulator transcription factor [Candidatus Dormibacteraeota bacterium]